VSVLSSVSAPAATHDLAGVVVALFSNPERAAPRNLPGSVGDQPPGDENQLAASVAGRLVIGPTGLGTSAARIPCRCTAIGETIAATGRGAKHCLPDGPTGLGTSAVRVSAGRSADGGSGSELYCPPAVRDDEAFGEEVNDRLIDWAEQIGIYPGQLDRLRACNFGRLMMLTHPVTNDPDRLLAAAKCALAEWATDDHFLDDESMGADAKVIGSRLGITYAAVDQVDLPVRYVPQLDQALSDEPVAVAYRSAFEHIARYAPATQVARLRHELSVMFMAYNHEADWHNSKRIPPVWEYLSDTDFDLPKVIAAEEKCSPQEAIERTVQIHNELMHTFVAEAAVLSSLGSLALRRFLADIWTWLGGNREWHSTTERYHDANPP
jgi:2-methylisoborneol synthase